MSDIPVLCPCCGAQPHGPIKVGGGDERMGYNFIMRINCPRCGLELSKLSHRDKNGWCDDTGQANSEVLSSWGRRIIFPDIGKDAYNPSEGLLGAVARGWCSEANENKTMDSDLAYDIARSVYQYLKGTQK